MLPVLKSLLPLAGGFLAMPYATGYFLLLTGSGPVGAIVFVTVWYWSVLYWGTWYHAKKITELFERK